MRNWTRRNDGVKAPKSASQKRDTYSTNNYIPVALSAFYEFTDTLYELLKSKKNRDDIYQKSSVEFNKCMENEEVEKALIHLMVMKLVLKQEGNDEMERTNAVIALRIIANMFFQD